MIIPTNGTKHSPKQAAARLIWTAINSYNDKPVTEISLYAEAGFDQEAVTEREEALIKVQIDRLSVRVKRLLKIEEADDFVPDVEAYMADTGVADYTQEQDEADEVQ